MVWPLLSCCCVQGVVRAGADGEQSWSLLELVEADLEFFGDGCIFLDMVRVYVRVWCLLDRVVVDWLIYIIDLEAGLNALQCSGVSIVRCVCLHTMLVPVGLSSVGHHHVSIVLSQDGDWGCVWVQDFLPCHCLCLIVSV